MVISHHLINLAVALSAAEVVHNIMEATSVRMKVTRLRAYIAGKSYKELPLNLNTRAKAYALSLFGLIVLVALFYGLASWWNPSVTIGFKVIAGLLVAAYVILVVLLDRYHVEIERVTQPFKKYK